MHIMHVPELKVVGECSNCKQSVEVNRGAASAHTHKGKHCKGSGYSVRNTQLVIQNPEEAHEVALFLKDDRHEICLSRPWGLHSGMCGDGKYCYETRQKLSGALSVYYLSLFPKKMTAAKIA